jgi:NADPH-ferrihemoprotein reductase
MRVIAAAVTAAAAAAAAARGAAQAGSAACCLRASAPLRHPASARAWPAAALPPRRRFAEAAAAAAATATTTTTAFSGAARLADAFKAPPKLTVVYGSQTGTAMSFAHALVKEARKRKFEAEVFDLAEFDPKAMASEGNLTVLITACFGHGEPTQNAENFYRWLADAQREGERDFFKGVRFCVFGLGQSKHYPDRYQAVGKYFDRRLGDLGALRTLPRGEGDDSGDIEGDFERWRASLFEALASLGGGGGGAAAAASVQPGKPAAASTAAAMGTGAAAAAAGQAEGASCSFVAPGPAATAGLSPIESIAPPTPVTAKLGSQVRPSAATGQEQQHDLRRPCSVPIAVNRELRGVFSRRSCRHVELDITGTSLKYQTGDYLGILPMNARHEVERVLRRLGLDERVVIDTSKHPMLASSVRACSISLVDALTHHCDIMNPPRRSVLRGLAGFARDAKERARLEMLADSTWPLARAEYQEWVVDQSMSLLDLLVAFPSVGGLSADDFVELLEPLTPRFYSICSSPARFPNSIHVVASVVDFVTPMGRHHRGVCTSFIREAREGDKMRVFVKNSLFKPPAAPTTPAIMVAAGTGIAPFRAFLQERSTDPRSKNLLFFGIGRRDEDFLFGEELLEYERAKVLQLSLSCGFERPWRQFVQHAMVEQPNAAQLWSLLRDHGASFYLCGDAKRMAPAVHEALLQVAQQAGGLSLTQASDFFLQLQREARYQLDVF